MHFVLRDVNGEHLDIKLEFGLEPDDVARFCQAHAVSFYAMGTPPGVADPNRLGWKDLSRFRVGTQEAMMGGSSRGITIPLEKVAAWKRDMQALSDDEEALLEDILDAARVIGKRHPAIEVSLIERSLRLVCAAADTWQLGEMARQPSWSAALAFLPAGTSFADDLEDVIAGARIREFDYETAMTLSNVLRDCLRIVPPATRMLWLESSFPRHILELGEATENRITV